MQTFLGGGGGGFGRWILSRLSWEGKDEGKNWQVREVITKCCMPVKRGRGRWAGRRSEAICCCYWKLDLYDALSAGSWIAKNIKRTLLFPPSLISLFFSPLLLSLFKSVNTHSSCWFSRCIDTQWEAKKKTAKSAQRRALTTFSRGLSLLFLRPPSGCEVSKCSANPVIEVL